MFSPIGRTIVSVFLKRFSRKYNSAVFFDFCKKSEILSRATNRFLRENSEIREVQNYTNANRISLVKILLLFGYKIIFLTPHTARTDPITHAHVFQTAVR